MMKQQTVGLLLVIYLTIISETNGFSLSWFEESSKKAIWTFAETALDSLEAPVCYGEFGCFNKTEVPPEFQIVKVSNLVGCYPLEPEQINTHFGVFSCNDPFNPTILSYNFTQDALNSINFDPKKRTIIIVHGYTDHYDQFNWMGDMKDTILRRNPCNFNVIVVDWRGGSKTAPNYLQAVANTRLVGAMIARTVKQFHKFFNLTNDDFTLIGHSLGGHIVGFAGKRLQNPDKTRLIISLDPAGPAFTNVSHESRICPDDGRLVVGIHTNGGAFGLTQPIGHYDFYPNGGSAQPGCDTVSGIVNILTSGLTEGLTDTIACAHRRAYELLIYDESQHDDYQTMAYTCSNHSDFTAGKCAECPKGSDQCRPFGSWFDYWQQQADGPSKKWMAPVQYFVDTWLDEPYSYFQYQIKIFTENGDFKPFTGQLQLNLTGSLRRDFIEMIRLQGKFEPNKEYHFLHKSRKSIGRIEKINATLVPGIFQSKTTDNQFVSGLKDLFGSNKRENSGNKTDNLAYIILKDLQVNYMNGHKESTRKEYSSRLHYQTGSSSSERAITGQVKFGKASLFFADGYTEQPGHEPITIFGQRDSNVNLPVNE